MTFKTPVDECVTHADAVVDIIDGLSTRGYLTIYPNSPPASITDNPGETAVAELRFSHLTDGPGGANAFGAASAAGVATANTIESDASAAGGTAAWFRATDGNNTENNRIVAFEGTVTATGGGGDLELDSVTIAATATVSVTSMTYTQPDTDA